MKLTKITTAIAALAAAAVLATSAHAAGTQVTYTSGDLFLGFEVDGGANDYVVNLGLANQFSGATTPLTFQLSTADLSSVFGSTWATNSGTSADVQWGVIGNDQNNGLGVGTQTGNTDGKSVWYTLGETVSGTPNTAPSALSASSLNLISNKIKNLDSATSGGFNGKTSTANTTNAIIESATASNSWTLFDPGTYSGGNAFGSGNDIEQPGSGSNTGPTDSVLDLFQANSGQTGDLLGEFSLSSSGLLTFDPAASLAVPEPSAYALGITALVLFGVLKRRKSIQA
jgi:hypothetical protein